MDKISTFISTYFDWFYITVPGTVDIIEILILSFFIYRIMLWFKQSRAWTLLKGIVMIVLFTAIAAVFQFNTILYLLKNAFSVGIIAVVILFQPEFRRGLEQLGRKRFMLRFFNFGDNSDKDERFSVKTADEIVDACYKMGAVKTGALIVIEQDIVLEEYIKTGIPVDGIVTSQLLINIFEHNTPLHDGAVIIRGNRVVAATCYLPLSDNNNLNKALGTRHRAGVGISEVTDSMTIIVSEETGKVSVAVGGELIHDIDADSLRNKLEYLRRRTIDVKSFKIWRGRLKHEGKDV